MNGNLRCLRTKTGLSGVSNRPVVPNAVYLPYVAAGFRRRSLAIEGQLATTSQKQGVRIEHL
jgi:hypothetical protein